MSEEPKKDNEANELQPEYGNRWPLKLFHSFEEMNEYDAKVRAETPGEQHLANVTFWIEQQYAEELKKPMDKKIHFLMIDGIPVEQDTSS
ncbi:MAG TPA: hypothetical protein VL651_00490 [Bacteroidia bacterium]|jgi:hypothetical protein|nr:hypothetical protein [Bacteroidia bacterium]